MDTRSRDRQRLTFSDCVGTVKAFGKFPLARSLVTGSIDQELKKHPSALAGALADLGGHLRENAETGHSTPEALSREDAGTEVALPRLPGGVTVARTSQYDFVIEEDATIDDFDAFDLKRWRAELEAEIGSAKSKASPVRKPSRQNTPGHPATRQQTPRQQTPRQHVSRQSVATVSKPSSAFTLDCSGQLVLRAGESSKGRATSTSSQNKASTATSPWTWPFAGNGGIRDVTVSEFSSEGKSMRNPTAATEMGLEDRLRICEAVYGHMEPGIYNICRDSLSGIMETRQRFATEQARRQRQGFSQAGRKNRCSARQWRQLRQVKALVEAANGGTIVERDPTDNSKEKGDEKKTEEEEETPTMKPPTPRGRSVQVPAVAEASKRKQAKFKALKNKARHYLSDVPHDEREAIQKAFRRCSESCNSIPAEKILCCLFELGLLGRNAHEKWVVERMCAEIVTAFNDEDSKTTGATQHRVESVARAPVPTSAAGRIKRELRLTTSGKRALPKSSVALARQPWSKEQGEIATMSCGSGIQRCHIFARPSRHGSCTGLGHVIDEESRDKGSPSEIENKDEDELADTSGQWAVGRAACNSPSMWRVGETEQSKMKKPAEKPEWPAITIDDFAVELIPAIRKMLADCRHDAHFQAFNKYMIIHTKTISLRQLYELLEDLELDPSCLGTGSSLFGFVPAKGDDSDFESERGPQIDWLDFDMVHFIALNVAEQTERSMREVERDIQMKENIPEAMFWQLRHELRQFTDKFRLCDSTGSGSISHMEAATVLKSLGLNPFIAGQSTCVRSLLAGLDDDSISFVSFYVLVDSLRTFQRSHRRRNIQRIFCKYARAGAFLVDMLRLMDMINAADLGNTESTDTAISKIIAQCETERIGLISFSEFEDLIQAVVEMLARLEQAKVVQEAQKLKITFDKLSRYQWVFDQLDKDSSGGLSLHEILQALEVQLGRPPDVELVKTLYSQVGKDPVRDELGLIEFLRLMQSCAKRGLL